MLKTIASQRNLDRFAMVLRAGMNYYPEEAGLLFQKGEECDKCACDLAFEAFSKKDTMDCIQACMPVNLNYQPYVRILSQHL